MFVKVWWFVKTIYISEQVDDPTVDTSLFLHALY